MSSCTYFVQECPTCGRSLEVRVEYLGREVICQHCRGHFTAYDPATALVPSVEVSTLLNRADQLLARMPYPKAAS